MLCTWCLDGNTVFLAKKDLLKFECPLPLPPRHAAYSSLSTLLSVQSSEGETGPTHRRGVAKNPIPVALAFSVYNCSVPGKESQCDQDVLFAMEVGFERVKFGQ